MQKPSRSIGSGFTLIETVLTVAVLGVAVSVGAALLGSFQGRADLDGVQTTLVSMLRRAQTLSLTASEDASWGVHIENGVFTLFKGPTWSTRNTSRDEVYLLPQSVTSSGLSQVVFAQITGIPDTTGTTTLTGKGGGESRVVINTAGTVEFGSIVPLAALPSEIDVFRGVTAVDVGTTDDQGAQVFGSPQVVTYTIENTGPGSLMLSGSPAVEITSLVNISSASVTAAPEVTIAPGESTTVSITYTPLGTGLFSFVVSIQNNDFDESAYAWTVSGTGYSVPLNPEMDVVSNVSVADGGVHNVGNQTRNVNTTVTYRIDNTGGGQLNLNGSPQVSVVAGTRIAAVSVSTTPSSTVSPGGSTLVEITYRPRNLGTFNFTVSIPNTDPNEAPYNWTVTGTSVRFGGGGAVGP